MEDCSCNLMNMVTKIHFINSICLMALLKCLPIYCYLKILILRH